MKIFDRLWGDDGGALIATEWLFVATLMIIGCVAGLQAIRASVNQQLEEVAGAINSLDPSYMVKGQRNAESETAGSAYIDSHVDVQIFGPQLQRELPPNVPLPPSAWRQRHDHSPHDDPCD